MTHTVTLSLISHTNVGKTTLARTLLRRDVGEVLDQAHVTEVSEAHDLLETSAARLRLWDTPGFGDSRRLMKRLRHEKDPLGWFLHQVWDRVVDRPLWCSQEAVRNIKQEADVVLYLVNAAEEPEDAGYVSLELDLLSWMGRPVLLLLNQVGRDGGKLEARWREFVEAWPIVRGVLSLDAFTRCWIEEGVLMQRVAGLLDGPKREAMVGLAAAWNERGLEVFRSCFGRMAAYLARAAADREAAGTAEEGQGTLSRLTGALKFDAIDKRQAMTRLNRRLDESTQELMAWMIAAHGLSGASATRIEQSIQDFQVKRGAWLDEVTGALTGAVVTGAIGGLAADALSGGLTLGGGLIAGGILGALSGSALARGYRMIGGAEEPSVKWTPEFLDQLGRQVLLRYLAVAHFGRGRGDYRDLEQPSHWSPAVEAALRGRRPTLEEAWKLAESGGPAALDRIESRLAGVVEETARTVLREAYPHAADVLS